jgi:hypothetical protein
MRYGYRHKRMGSHKGEIANKKPGVLLRVHKSVVNPEAYKRNRFRSKEVVNWTGGDIPPHHIEVHQGGGRWKPLLDSGV